MPEPSPSTCRLTTAEHNRISLDGLPEPQRGHATRVAEAFYTFTGRTDDGRMRPFGAWSALAEDDRTALILTANDWLDAVHAAGLTLHDNVPRPGCPHAGERTLRFGGAITCNDCDTVVGSYR